MTTKSGPYDWIIKLARATLLVFLALLARLLADNRQQRVPKPDFNGVHHLAHKYLLTFGR